MSGHPGFVIRSVEVTESFAHLSVESYSGPLPIIIVFIVSAVLTQYSL